MPYNAYEKSVTIPIWENEKRNMCWLPSGEVSEVVEDKDMKPLNTMFKKIEEFDGLRIYKLK